MTCTKHHNQSGLAWLVCGALCLFGAAAPAVTHAEWVYSGIVERLPEGTHFETIYGDDAEAVVQTWGLDGHDIAGGSTTSTQKDVECWLAVKVKCVGHEVSDWVYKFKSIGENGWAKYDCPDGSDVEWSQGGLWVGRD